MNNKLRRIWQDGGTAHGGWLSLYDDFAASLMGDVGFDYLVVDMQNHGSSTQNRSESAWAIRSKRSRVVPVFKIVVQLPSMRPTIERRSR